MNQNQDPGQDQAPFWKGFLPLFIMGCIGILSLIPTIYPLIVIQQQTSEKLARLSPITAIVLSLSQPVFFLAALTAIGSILSPALGLKSQIVEKLKGSSKNKTFWKKDFPSPRRTVGW